jgi:hypothetical protein
MKPRDIANVQIGTTTDRVAAGGTLSISTAGGDVISAIAATPIRTNRVAFQYLDGRWMAFDFSVSAITSRRKTLTRTRPKPKLEAPGFYPFKGLVRFLNEILYQGGDDNLVQLDTDIPIDDPGYEDYTPKYYVLGFSNLGSNKLSFLAIWRKNNNLLVYENAVLTVLSGWFLKGFESRYLGHGFYGINGQEIRRDFEDSSYDTETTWGSEISQLPFVGNIDAPPPTIAGNSSGIEEIEIDEQSTMIEPVFNYKRYTETEVGTASFTRSHDETFPIISWNYGQTVDGTGTYNRDLSISFTIDCETVYTSNDFSNTVLEVFEETVTGTMTSHVEAVNNWVVYLDRTDTVSCSSSSITDTEGDLSISYVYGQPEATSFSGTTSRNRTATSNTTSLMLSGYECYMFSTGSFSDSYSGSSTHSNDHPYDDETYTSIVPNRSKREEVYWYEYKQDRPSTWFATSVTESRDLSGTSSVKFKNVRDNSIIECNPNSITFFVPTDAFPVDQAIELECSAFSTVGINNNAYYESIEKYTLSYTGRSTRQGTLSGAVTAERMSDDTLHNAIFNGLLTRQYEIVWFEDNKYYLGDVTITSADIEIIEQEDYPLGEVAGYPGEDLGLESTKFVLQKFKNVKGLTCIITNKRRINASLFRSQVNAAIISKDNYLTYITSVIGLNGSDAGGGFNIRNVTLFLRDNPVIVTTNIPTAGDITSNRQMYAEILELLPDGRWVRKEQEDGDVTAMSVGTPDTNTDFWSYYKE